MAVCGRRRVPPLKEGESSGTEQVAADEQATRKKDQRASLGLKENAAACMRSSRLARSRGPRCSRLSWKLGHEGSISSRSLDVPEVRDPAPPEAPAEASKERGAPSAKLEELEVQRPALIMAAVQEHLRVTAPSAEELREDAGAQSTLRGPSAWLATTSQVGGLTLMYVCLYVCICVCICVCSHHRHCCSELLQENSNFVHN